MEMDWRQRRTVTMLTAVLLILLAAVLIVLGIRYRENRQEEGEGPETRQASAMSGGAYSTLAYSNGSTTLSFSTAEDGMWFWDNDPEFPLKQDTVNAILALLNNWRPQQSLAAEEELSTYGLDQPAGFLTLGGEGGAIRTLSFGKTTTDGDSHYVMEEDDPSTVYIVADTLFNYMGVPIYDMMELPVLPQLPESAIRSILIRGPEGEDETPGPVTMLTAVKRSGDDGPVTWLQGGENVTANKTVQALLEDVGALALSRCVDYHPSDEAAVICGFDAPAAVLTINYTTDTGIDETLALTIGTKVLDNSGRYVRLNGEAAIYALPTAALDPLMRVSVNGLDLTE